MSKELGNGRWIFKLFASIQFTSTLNHLSLSTPSSSVWFSVLFICLRFPMITGLFTLYSKQSVFCTYPNDICCYLFFVSSATVLIELVYVWKRSIFCDITLCGVRWKSVDVSEKYAVLSVSVEEVLLSTCFMRGTRQRSWLRYYKPEGRGIESWWGGFFFQLA
jgi:hypothetical protein